MRIFISHCSDDAKLIDEYKHIFKTGKKDQIFFSSDPQTGIKSGSELMTSINKEIKNCNLFVCIITENYVRSDFCLYEFNVATFLTNKKMGFLPIVTNDNVYKRVKKTIEHLNLIYINAANKKGFSYRFKEVFKAANDNDIEGFREKLEATTRSTRNYVAMDENFYHNVVSYCEEQDICSMKNKITDNPVLIERVKKADEVVILSTTGASIIKVLASNALVDALKNKATIKIIVPNQDSDFLYDVARSERPDDTETRFKELHNEYDQAMGYLIEAYKKAKSQQDDIGTIEYYCSYTLLRQTLVLTRINDDVYGSMSTTLPPRRTVDGTPTITFNGKISENKMSSFLFEHAYGIIQNAKRNGDVIVIDEHSDKKPFYLEKTSVRDYWINKCEEAKKKMIAQDVISDSILIEIAAQHPLTKSGEPGKEFKARLERGIELYNSYKEQNLEVKIFIPGSLHKYKGVVDVCSLSQSGINYLLAKGIPQEDIYEESILYKYKGEDGVYNTADECYVASKIFYDDNYAQLVSVCSPNQVLRKTLLYIEFGIIPYCYSVPVDKMYHNAIDELFDNINYILFKDHDCQNPNSEFFISSRKERKP